MDRDIAKYESFNHLHTVNGVLEKGTCRVQYGNCNKLNKPVGFIPNTCQIETQDCFKHRRNDK